MLNFDRRSDRTFFSASHKQSPMSYNTSVIDVISRSTSLAGGKLVSPQKRVPPKLDLTKITRKESEGNIDDVEI